MFITRIFTLFFFILMVSGCEKNTEDLTGFSHVELRKKWRECAYIQSPSNDEKKTCNDYETECKKRKNEGNLACY